MRDKVQKHRALRSLRAKKKEADKLAETYLAHKQHNSNELKL